MIEDKLKISGMHDGATPPVFRNASRLREQMTEPEKKFWEYLKAKPLGFKWRRQHPIGAYILDFYCHKLKMSIEVDGGYHLADEQRKKDEERTHYLNDLGIKEYRFNNKRVLTDYENVITEINSIMRDGIL